MTKKLFAVALFCAVIFTLSFQTSAKANRAAYYPYIQNERLLPLALREIYDAQNIYQETIGNGNFGSFSELINAGLLNDAWSRNIFRKYGYGFQILKSNRVFNTSTPAKFRVVTFPLTYRRTGRKSFSVDYLGAVRAEDKNGAVATGEETTIGSFPYVPFTVRSDIRAISVLRLIHSAQMTYQATNGNGNFGMLEQLYNAGLINQYLRTGAFGGYNFVVIKRDLVQGIFPASFYSTATPDQYNLTGIRSFYIDETGVIRGADKNGAAATVQDPPIEE